MASIKYGILGPIIGKISNLVTYIRYGVPVVRTKPKKKSKKAKRSIAQQAVNLRFLMVKKFVAVIREFINVGYQFDVADTPRIPENGAVSYLLKEAVTGVYPDYEMDFSKVLVSKGKLPVPLNPTVKLDGDTLKFRWTVDPKWSYKLNRDQVMLLAYLPANNTAEYLLSGARRNEGSEELKVSLVPKTNSNANKDEYIETYIAFISDDRKRISDSVYVGRVSV